MTKTRQDFISGRIQAGQVKIVSPVDLAAPAAAPTQPQQKSDDNARPQPRPQPRAYSSVNRYRGKLVKIQMNNGQTIYGILAEVWQYEIVVHTDVNVVVVMKHAICTIEEVGTNLEPVPEQEPTATTPIPNE